MPNLDLTTATGIRIANVDVEALRIGPYILWELTELPVSVFGSTTPAQPTSHSDADAGSWVSTQFYCPLTGASLLGAKIIGARLYVPIGSTHIGQTWRAAIIRSPLAIVTSGVIQSSDFDTNGSKTEGDLIVAGWNEVLFDEEWPGVDNGGSWNIGIQIGTGTRYLHDGTELTSSLIASPDLNFVMAELDKRSFYNNDVVPTARWYSIDALVERPDPDLIAAYNFDESGNTFIDVSGNGHDSTVDGALRRSTDFFKQGSGAAKAAAVLAGGSGAGASGVPMTDFNNAGSRSLVCWVAARSASPGTWIFRWQKESIDSGTFGLYMQSSILRARVRVGGTAFNAQSALTPTIDAWYHAAAVYDASAQTIKLYLDGSLVATTSVTNSGDIDTADGVDISSDSTTVDSSSPGSWVVDSPEIYSRALTLAEVQAHMGGG